MNVSLPPSNNRLVSVLPPIVVELERTLAASDIAYEQCVRAVASQPLRALTALALLWKESAGFKQTMARIALPGVPAFREDVVAWLRAEADNGRPIHLVTVADQPVADAVANELHLFESAKSYPNGVTCSEANKLAWLNSRFPDGFDHLDDAASDPKLRQAARLVHLGNDANMTDSGQRDITLGPVFIRRQPSMRDWMNALRVQQWSKNFLLFVPLILSRTFADPMAVLKVVCAFFIFNAVVSATYIFNDVLDIMSDRRHPIKRNRAIAAGIISARAAIFAAVWLLILSFAASAALGPVFAAVLFFYLIVTAAYSLSVKRMPLGDVFTIGVLFSTRVGAGAVAIPVFVSPWLISFSFLFFFSLALAKRHVEVIRASRVKCYTLEGRGYRPDDWPLTLAVGVAAALASMVIMLIYIQEAAIAVGGFHHLVFLYPIAAIILLWVMRLWVLSHRGELDDDPVVFAFKDKFSLALAAACVALLALAI